MNYRQDYLGEPITMTAALVAGGSAVSGLVQSWFGYESAKQQARSAKAMAELQYKQMQIEAEIMKANADLAARLADTRAERKDLYTKYVLMGIIGLAVGVVVFAAGSRK